MNQMKDRQRTNNPLEVLIVGAGTGGLCLAQGLKSDGISVQVFERDQAPFDPQAGYRLSINPTGNRALKECLPEPLFETLVNSSVKPSRGVSFLAKAKVSNTQDSVNSADSSLPFANRKEYVMWGFSARREKFGLTRRHETVRPEDLKTAAMALMKDWSPALRQIVQQTSDLGMFPVKT